MLIVSLPEDTKHLYTVNQEKELHFQHSFFLLFKQTISGMGHISNDYQKKKKNISQDFHELENPWSVYYALLLFKKRQLGSGSLPDATEIWREAINLSNYSILDQPLRSE